MIGPEVGGLHHGSRYFGDLLWYPGQTLAGSRGTVVSMLLGTGVDLIEVQRIVQSIERFGDRFLNRIYTDREIAYCSSRRFSGEGFAARFAAKEAGAKALGTGMNFGITWREIEVTRSAAGRPSLEFWGEAGRVARRLGVQAISLSLTHTSAMAIAMVILEA